MYATIARHSAQPLSDAVTPTSEETLEVRVAGTEAEYEEAFRIAYDVYYPLGFTEYSPVGLRIAPAQLSSGSVVLLAYHQGHAIATLSLYEDGAEGIPSESGWPEEIERLRAQGRTFFELGSLMVLPGHIHLGARLCMELFRAACLYVRNIKKADSICAFVTPKHAWFYGKMMSFQEFGPPQPYHWNGLSFPEVVPLVMDLSDVAEENFRKRFESWGDSPRNLYRFFIIEGVEALRRLRLELSRRDNMDFNALAERFGRYLPATLKEKIIES